MARPMCAIVPYLEHCMPLYGVEPSDPNVLPRTINNFEVMSRFQTGEHRTKDLAPGLFAARSPVLVLAGELAPVCPVAMSDEIVAALVNADVTYERIPDASHDDVGPQGNSLIRAFIAADS